MDSLDKVCREGGREGSTVLAPNPSLLHNVESEHVHEQSARIERTKGASCVSTFFMFCERYRAIGHALPFLFPDNFSNSDWRGSAGRAVIGEQTADYVKVHLSER